MKVEMNCPICGYETKNPEGYFIGIICGCCGNEMDVDNDITPDEIKRFGTIIIDKANEINLNLSHFDNNTLPKDVANSLLRLVWVAKGCPWIYTGRKEKPQEWSLEAAKKQLQSIGLDIEDYYTANSLIHQNVHQYEKNLSTVDRFFCPICGYSFEYKGGYVMHDKCGCCSYIMEIDNDLSEDIAGSFDKNVLKKAEQLGYDTYVYDGYTRCSESYINVLLRIQWINNGLTNKNAKSQGIPWNQEVLQKQLNNIHIDLNNYL